MFADPGGQAGPEQCVGGAVGVDRLRGPLLTAGVPLSEQELQDVVKAIEDFIGRRRAA